MLTTAAHAASSIQKSPTPQPAVGLSNKENASSNNLGRFQSGASAGTHHHSQGASGAGNASNKRWAKRQAQKAQAKPVGKTPRKAAAAKDPAAPSHHATNQPRRPKPVQLHKPAAAEKVVTSDRRRSVKVGAAVQPPSPQPQKRPAARDASAYGARGANQPHHRKTSSAGADVPDGQLYGGHRYDHSAAMQRSATGPAGSNPRLGVPGSKPSGAGASSHSWPHRDLHAALSALDMARAEYALRRIEAAMTRDAATRDKMTYEGLPTSLISVLKYDVAPMEMRRSATYIIAELSVDDRYEQVLVDAGTVHVLVWLINPRNVDDRRIMTNACRGLRNLLGGTQPTAIQAAKYGCVEPLLQIVDGRAGFQRGTELALEAVAAVCNLAHHGSRFQSYIIKHGGLSSLCALGKTTTSDETMFHIVNVVAELGLEDKWHKSIVAADGLVMAFRAMDVADDPEVVAEAARLVGNVAVTHKNRLAVRDAGGLVVLLDRLALCSKFTEIIPAYDLTRAVATVCTDAKSASDALSVCDGASILLRVYTYPGAPQQLVSQALRALQILAQGSGTRRAKVLYAIGIHVKHAAIAGRPTKGLYDLRQAILDDSRAEDEAMGGSSEPMPQTLERLSRVSVKLINSGVTSGASNTKQGASHNGPPVHEKNRSLPQRGAADGDHGRSDAVGNTGAARDERHAGDGAQSGRGVDRITGQSGGRAKFKSAGRVLSVTTRSRRDLDARKPNVVAAGEVRGKPADLRHLADAKPASKAGDDDDDEIARGNEQVLSDDAQERARMLALEVDGDMSKEIFEIGQLLGKGGYGSVLLAKNLRTDELVAIKTFHNSGALVDKKALKEQRVWKGLHHPNVVEFKGSFLGDSGSLNLVVEYVDGLSLAEHLSQYSAFPETLVAEIARQVLCGLAYLHAKGVTHRDLKPANILVDNDAAVKICDFGVSSAEHVQTINPGQQHMVGTPWYIAPEMVEYRPYTKSVDIWSLGCTIMELATGRRPYHELSAMQVLFRMVEDRCPPIPSSLSPELTDFLRSCFVWDPEERPSAAQLMRHPFIRKARDFAAEQAGATPSR